MSRFAAFVAIDWSGAVGAEHYGIAVARCDAGSNAAPVLIAPPDRRWSRMAVLDWITTHAREDMLVGFDLGPAFPFVDCDAYFPGWSQSPTDARALWALVERICADEPHLGARPFVDHKEASRYFRRQGRPTDSAFGAGRGRLRDTEHAQRAQGLNPCSNFNLVGAAQVGKSSLTGMRLLHRLGNAWPVWPFDSLPRTGSVIVEIYTSLAAVDAGRPRGRSKMRSVAELNTALDKLDSMGVQGTGAITDHASDALLTAAWMRRAADSATLWAPPALSSKIARTEGWTFGVR